MVYITVQAPHVGKEDVVARSWAKETDAEDGSSYLDCLEDRGSPHPDMVHALAIPELCAQDHSSHFIPMIPLLLLMPPLC